MSDHEKVYGVCENKCFVELPYGYSFEETVYGKWIDGKTIYQRAFFFDEIKNQTISVGEQLNEFFRETEDIGATKLFNFEFYNVFQDDLEIMSTVYSPQQQHFNFSDIKFKRLRGTTGGGKLHFATELTNISDSSMSVSCSDAIIVARYFKG